MNDKALARFPSGWLVIAFLIASGVLWAVLFFVTVARLQFLAGGAAPFDIRSSGYSYEEARDYLAALGARGRAYYLNPELVLDSFFPPLYAGSRALALWWLTMPGRLRIGAVSVGWRWALLTLPIAELIFDCGENAGIATMIWTWPDLSPAVVRAASTATQLKFAAVALTEISMIVLAVAALLRCLRQAPR
jgi:hypothetical protein